MINLFGAEALKTDSSVGYLSQIFGNMSGVLGTQGGDITILSTMFKTFNSMILVLAVLVLVYVTVIGVIGTAHEGEFMGKKLNNIWIPIRAVLGIALLVPTGAGYCGIQIIMMWIIVQGIGAADTLWMTALDYINIVGSPYAQVNVPVTGSSSSFTSLFQGLTCEATMRKGDPKDLGGYDCSSSGGCGKMPAFDPEKATYDLGKCGSLSYCNSTATQQGDTEPSCSEPGSMKCLACKAQVGTLAQIIPTLGGIAQQLVNADYSYRDFYVNSWNTDNNPEWQWIYKYCASAGISKGECCVKGYGTGGTCKAVPDAGTLPKPNDDDGKVMQSANIEAVKKIFWPYWPKLEPTLGQNEDFIKTAVGYYQDIANAAVATYAATSQNASGNLALPTANSVINNSKANGWIFAGALYYQLASLNSDRLKSSVTNLTWAPAALTGSIHNNLSAATYLIDVARGNTSMSTLSTPANQEMSSANKEITEQFRANVSGGGVNPLMMLQIFGALMIIMAEVLFFAMVLIILGIGILGYLDVYVLGTGFDNPIGPAALLVELFLLPLIWGALAFLATTGALLSIYTPLLPYIYFTFGALAWMISTVEAMVAGPLVALGIISPSGQHEMMGKAEPAILLLFNLFLRPSLMIFGLIVAMLLAVVGCRMVNETFAYVMINWAYPDPLTMVFMLIAYVSLILAVLNKCFAVINLIPQQVIRWISGHGEAVEAPTEAMKGAIEAGAGKAGGAMEGTGAKAKEQGRTAEAKEQAERTKKLQDAKAKKLKL